MNSFQKMALKLATILVVAISFSSAFAQGTVIFANNAQFFIPGDRLVRDANGNLLVGTNFLAQLYYGAPGAAEMDLLASAKP